VILVEVIGIWRGVVVGTWELGKLIHLLLHVVDGLFGTLVNGDKPWIVPGC